MTFTNDFSSYRVNLYERMHGWMLDCLFFLVNELALHFVAFSFLSLGLTWWRPINLCMGRDGKSFSLATEKGDCSRPSKRCIGSDCWSSREATGKGHGPQDWLLLETCMLCIKQFGMMWCRNVEIVSRKGLLDGERAITFTTAAGAVRGTRVLVACGTQHCAGGLIINMMRVSPLAIFLDTRDNQFICFQMPLCFSLLPRLSIRCMQCIRRRNGLRFIAFDCPMAISLKDIVV
jgi:hypothetical protein